MREIRSSRARQGPSDSGLLGSGGKKERLVELARSARREKVVIRFLTKRQRFPLHVFAEALELEPLTDQVCLHLGLNGNERS